MRRAVVFFRTIMAYKVEWELGNDRSITCILNPHPSMHHPGIVLGNSIRAKTNEHGQSCVDQTKSEFSSQGCVRSDGFSIAFGANVLQRRLGWNGLEGDSSIQIVQNQMGLCFVGYARRSRRSFSKYLDGWSSIQTNEKPIIPGFNGVKLEGEQPHNDGANWD